MGTGHATGFNEYAGIDGAVLRELEDELEQLGGDAGDKGYPQHMVFENLVEILHESMIWVSCTDPVIRIRVSGVECERCLLVGAGGDIVRDRY